VKFKLYSIFDAKFPLDSLKAFSSTFITREVKILICINPRSNVAK
jgi:hypothetical protein